MIRLTVPSLSDEDFQAVRDVLATGYLVQGPQVAALEEELAAYLGVAHAVAVSNCTAALHLSLLALGVGAGDRVAVAAYSWPATANVVVLCGAEPVFVDVDPTTYNISPSDLERVLAGPRVKAILPVHAFGNMADMPRIQALAEKYRVPIVEDAACALGAEMHGRKAGAWGVLGCFSFHPRKAITTGEGGLVVTQDASLAKMVRILRNHGLDPDAPAPDFIAAGYNLRLTEFQGALGRSQFRKLERIIAAREAGAAYYDELLRPTPLQPPVPQRGSRHIYQSYAPLLPREMAPHRAALIRRVKEEGIEATIGTYAIPLTTYYRQHGGYTAEQFPATADVAARALSLPLYEGLTRLQQQEVVDKLCRAVAEAPR
jgi:perosamine synthetase